MDSVAVAFITAAFGILSVNLIKDCSNFTSDEDPQFVLNVNCEKLTVRNVESSNNDSKLRGYNVLDILFRRELQRDERILASIPRGCVTFIISQSIR